MQALQPLAVEDIGFGTAGGTLGLARINEHDLQASTFQQFEKRDPLHACRFPGHRGDATRHQPVGQGVEIAAEGAEAAHGLGITLGWHGNPVLGFADSNAGGVEIENI
jgi:hypothetical protein